MSACALQLLPGESMALVVRFGSSEYPKRECVALVRPAEEPRFYLVRRTNGDLARVHDTQIEDVEGTFSRWAQINVSPKGRW